MSALISAGATQAQTDNLLNLKLLGTYASGQFDEAAAEISAYDPGSQRIFTTNAFTGGITVLDASNPASLSLLFEIDLSSYGAGANSVVMAGSFLAAAVEADDTQANGSMVIFDTDGNFVAEVEVGALPDMIALTPDGTKLLTANEGEPNSDYTVDPEGSVSVIDISGGVESLSQSNVVTVTFEGLTNEQLEGVRIFGNNFTATPAQDLEPEYIAVSSDSQTAYVLCQENNAVLVLDLNSNTLTDVWALGTKDHSLPGNGFDASNESDDINITTWPVRGFYLPDATKAYNIGGSDYLFTANEGDARDYDTYSEETRVADLVLDAEAFPNAAELQLEENLGRLNITTAYGDLDDDGEYEELYSYGARSFSIWDNSGNLIFDSGEDFERVTAQYYPNNFNANNDGNGSKSRSDDKGPEPEALEVAAINGRVYCFIGLERIGGIMIYDVTNPAEATFINYINNRDFAADAETAEAGDLGVEDIKFIPAAQSPSGTDLLLVSNEVSGTVSLFEIVLPAYTLQLLHASDLEGGVEAIERAPDFAAIVDKLEDEFSNTIKISAGDNYIPGPFFNAASDASVQPVLQSVYQDFYNEPGLNNIRAAAGRIDIAITNVLGLDASALGNHEFDAGTPVVAELVGQDIQGSTLGTVRWLGSQYPYLSANLDFSASELSGLFTDEVLVNTAFQALPSDLIAAADAPKIAPATLIERGGETIGVIGATTQVIASISSPGTVQEITGGANDMVALANVLQPIIDNMVAEGVNKIVLVSHLQQIALEQELAGLLSGVDIIVAGGSDAVLADDNDRLASGDEAVANYPISAENADGDPVLIVNTAGEYSYVGRLVVGFDGDGIVLPNSLTSGINGIYVADEQMVEAVWANAGDPFAPNTRGDLVSRLVNAASAVVEAKDGNIAGLSAVYLDGRRTQVRTQETNLGNLSADANLFVAKQFDNEVKVSIKNGGGIRAAIGEVVETSPGVFEFLPPQANPVSGKLENEVSQLDIENSLRFNNLLTVLTLSASDLKAVMEHAFSATTPGATPGQFPQVGGMRVSFDPQAEPGNRVRSLVLVNDMGVPTDTIVRNGNIRGTNRQFKVVTLNFLAGGGDGYPFDELGENFVELTAVSLPDGNFTFAAAGSEQDALAEYLSDLYSTVPYGEAETPASEDQRIQIIGERNDEVYVFCGEGLVPAPVNLRTVQSASSTTVKLRWRPVPGTVACRVRLGEVGAQNIQSYDVFGDEPRELVVNKSDLNAGALYRWRVVCACSTEPRTSSEFSELDLFVPLAIGSPEENSESNLANMGIEQLALWPNPSENSNVTLSVVGNEQFATTRIQLTDLQGRLVNQQENQLVVPGLIELQTATLAPGIYLVKLSNASGIHTQKVLVK